MAGSRVRAKAQSSGDAEHDRGRVARRNNKMIEQRGGKICVPKMAIPNVGWLAYAADPAGNVFGPIEPDTDAR